MESWHYRPDGNEGKASAVPACPMDPQFAYRQERIQFVLPTATYQVRDGKNAFLLIRCVPVNHQPASGMERRSLKSHWSSFILEQHCVLSGGEGRVK